MISIQVSCDRNNFKYEYCHGWDFARLIVNYSKYTATICGGTGKLLKPLDKAGVQLMLTTVVLVQKAFPELAVGFCHGNIEMRSQQCSDKDKQAYQQSIDDMQNMLLIEEL